jgi:hypothetical protein
MPNKQRQTAFRIPTDLSDAMQAVKDRDGVPQSEQVRRAIREWLEKRGVLRPVFRPDSTGPDWPKRTTDIDADGRPVRRAKKVARR